MTTKDITLRTITLSEETAELFNCKQILDDCFERVNKAHDKYFGTDKEFGSKWYDAFCEMNNIIAGLLIQQIDYNSTDSNYKVI